MSGKSSEAIEEFPSGVFAPSMIEHAGKKQGETK
jgi:hypothetical protein